MDNIEDRKRLFFGFEVHAPWPETLPDARTLKAKHRHLTLAFLGDTSYSKIRDLIPRLPKPHFRVGPVGISDSCLALPKRHPNVVTWHVDPFGEDLIDTYQKELSEFLEGEGYQKDRRKFLKHITLGRSPFNKREWKKRFRSLPLYFHHFHLYESYGGLRYEPIWSHDLFPPFEEMESREGLVFRVYGKSLQQIFYNAQIALAFKCSELLPFLDPRFEGHSIEEGILQLNAIVARASKEAETPQMRVEFQGEVTPIKGVLMWEMVVNV